MILQQLQIHNIASIEDATIDFEAQPLADSEVFLITGKTGAGKSTILDAICLALYATTPRLDNTLMQGDTKDQEKEIKIKDPVQLMRRNTGEAYVKFTFTGSNAVHYEATWSVARARNKVTGKIQGKKWSLRNLDTDFIYTKDKEIKDEIALAIGLDFKQFCRTTLLAQGEFTRFLNSKDDDKAEILEKITGVDAYSKIGAKIFEMTNEKRKAWENSKQSIEGIKVLSDEEIASKNAELSEFDQQLTTLKAQSDKANKKVLWLKEKENLHHQKEQAQEAYRQVRSLTESDSTKQTEFLINQWNATIEARTWLKGTERCTENIRKQEATLSLLANDFHRLMDAQAFEQKQQAEVAQNIQKLDAFLEAESKHVAIYENAQTLCNDLCNIDRYNKQITERKTSADSYAKQLQEKLLPQVKQEQAKLQDMLQSHEKWGVQIKQEQLQLQAQNLPSLRKQSDDIKQLLNDIANVKTLLAMSEEECSRFAQAQKDLSELQTTIEAKEKNAVDLAAEVHDAETKRDVLKAAYEKQRESINKWAKTVRLNLAIGDVCPVCQQKISSALPHEDVIDALVAETAQLFKEADKKYEQTVNRKNALDAEIKALKTTYSKDAAKLEKDKTSWEQTKQKAQAAMENCAEKCKDILFLESKVSLEVGEQQAHLHLENLTAKIAEAEAKEQAVKALQSQAELLRQKSEKQRVKEQYAQKQHDECQQQIAVLTSLINSATTEKKKTEQKVMEIIPLPTSPLEYAEQLQKAADIYQENKEKRLELAALLDKYTLENEHVAANMDAILQAMPSWKTDSANSVYLKEHIANLLAKTSELQSQVVSILNQIKVSKENMEKNQQQLHDFLESHADEGLRLERLKELSQYTQNFIAEKQQALDKLRLSLVEKETILKAATDAENQHQQMAQDTFTNEELELLAQSDNDLEATLPQTKKDFISSLKTQLAELEASQKELGEKRGGIIRDLEIDRENKEKMGSLITDSEKKKAEYEKWSRLSQLLGDAQGNKFRRIAQSYVLASLIHSANGYMHTLTDRYILKVIPGSFVITMEDAYQGYVSRAASTLSGGESFLVSLSLALALSDIGNQLSVDTLFIDEGFGTLSGEPLQHAINTLRSLHSKSGRHVGIISHVEELKERIPVQIRVNQEGNNSSSTVEVVG